MKHLIIAAALVLISSAAYAYNCNTTCQRIGQFEYCNTYCN